MNNYIFLPGDLGIIAGGIRNGKTLEMVFMAALAMKEGYDLYYNMKSLDLPGLKEENYISGLIDFKSLFHRVMGDRDLIKTKKFLILDELGSLMPATEYSSLKWLSKYVTQLNKIGFTTYGTAQSFDMVYNRFRDNCNKRVLVERIGLSDTFKVIVQLQSRKKMAIYKTLFTYYFDGQLVYDLYDTHEVLYIDPGKE